MRRSRAPTPRSPLKPDHVEALNNRGHTLHQLGRADEAMTSYMQALAIRPDFAEASN